MSHNGNTELMETLFDQLIDKGYTEDQIIKYDLVDKLFYQDATMEDLLAEVTPMSDADDNDDYIDESMDGDHESALASCGWGTDEDYGDYGYDSYQ